MTDKATPVMADDGPPVEQLKKATAGTAGEIGAHCDLGAPALRLLGDGSEAPTAFLRRLIEAGHLADAVTFLAHALPPREGVWWACQAARTLGLGSDEALPRRTVRAAEAWVFQPVDARRRAAMSLAEELGFDVPASWAAVAAFWSGDSLAPAEQPKVAPEPHLYCHAVGGGVLLAASRGPADRIAARQRGLLGLGVDIANGGTGRPTTQVPGDN